LTCSLLESLRVYKPPSSCFGIAPDRAEDPAQSDLLFRAERRRGIDRGIDRPDRGLILPSSP